MQNSKMNTEMGHNPSEQTAMKVSQSNRRGELYVVATPIGNLSDISQRALKVLAEVDTVLAEDTRHSKQLFNHYGISTPLKACHEHNEDKLIEWVKQKLSSGDSLALISDAGTPLISDPGFVLVRALREAAFPVLVVPGPSSVIAALSISGLATDRFLYAGFLPSKPNARRTALEAFLYEGSTVVLLEACHRIAACLKDMNSVLGSERNIVLARELTKKFETVIYGPISSVLAKVEGDENQTRGEFVVLIEGVSSKNNHQDDIEAIRTLNVLLEELPVKQAATLTAKLCGLKKNHAYQLALELKESNES